MSMHAGCCCRVHTGSFGAPCEGVHQAPDEAYIERALRHAGCVPIITDVIDAPIVNCDGSMTCVCGPCSQARRQRQQLASRDVRQPWEARPHRVAA